MYDKPYSGQNKLLSFYDVYTQVGKDQENSFGFPLAIGSCPITFTLGDPITKPDKVNEGFQIYWFKDLVDTAPNKEYDVYAVLQYNNAGNGKTYDMAASRDINPNNSTLSSLEGNGGLLYLKITLKNDNGVYKYMFKPNAKQIQLPPGVNLNPSSGGIPTLTFWQITP